MKKLLSIALVLVFALSLAAPALAYTNVTDAGSSPYAIDIYLVDYSSTLVMFGSVPSLSLPATNRAYGVNEVVAAIASFTVPANTTMTRDYGKIVFKSNNVNFLVTDNRLTGTSIVGFVNDVARTLSTSNSTLTNFSSTATDEFSLNLDTGAGHVVIGVSDKAQKYSFLMFGKVLDDDADLSIELQRGASFVDLASSTVGGGLPARLMPRFGTITEASLTNLFVSATNASFANGTFVVLNNDYVVYSTAGNDAKRVYVVTNNPSDPADLKQLLTIEVNAKNETEGVVYYDGATPYRFYMTASGDIAINNTASTTYAAVATNSTTYASLVAGFTALFDDLGLTLSNRTNIMKHAYWTDMANASNLKETISIDPLALPYIQVPEVEVTTPPKTGSAASILGFVIIAMAGVAAVVVRKVRA